MPRLTNVPWSTGAAKYEDAEPVHADAIVISLFGTGRRCAPINAWNDFKCSHAKFRRRSPCLNHLAGTRLPWFTANIAFNSAGSSPVTSAP